MTKEPYKFYMFQLRNEKAVKKLEIDVKKKYGRELYIKDWFPKSKEFLVSTGMFLDENLEKKERSIMF